MLQTGSSLATGNAAVAKDAADETAAHLDNDNGQPAEVWCLPTACTSAMKHLP